MNLKRMRCGIEDLLSHMNGVSDDYDFGNAFLGRGLVNAISNSEQLCFYTSDKSCMMNSFGERSLGPSLWGTLLKP